VTGAAERLRDGLRALGRVRVPLDTVLSVWASAAPELTGSAESLAALAASLRTLADAGLLDLPAARSWDRSTRPPLPRFVTVPASRRERTPDRWRSFPWRKELGWVASLPYVADTNFEALVAIDTWLARRDPDGPSAPVRVRSAEVFGDEKRLDDLLKTRLFGPGRLSLELLGAVRYPPPLPTRLVGDAPSVLIVENVDPFWVCVEAARGAVGSVGRVAWGAGKSAVASVASLAWDDPRPSVIWYWGDLDPEGVRIAADVARAAEVVGLPPVRPAMTLWSAMLAHPGKQPGTVRWEDVSGTWLGHDLWSRAAPVRAAHARVAQEDLGVEEVARAVGRLP